MGIQWTSIVRPIFGLFKIGVETIKVIGSTKTMYPFCKSITYRDKSKAVSFKRVSWYLLIDGYRFGV